MMLWRGVCLVLVLLLGSAQALSIDESVTQQLRPSVGSLGNIFIDKLLSFQVHTEGTFLQAAGQGKDATVVASAVENDQQKKAATFYVRSDRWAGDDPKGIALEPATSSNAYSTFVFKPEDSDQVTQGSPPNGRAATWYVRRGLVDPQLGFVSFESKAKPGFFLTAEGTERCMLREEDKWMFAAASFLPTEALFKSDQKFHVDAHMGIPYYMCDFYNCDSEENGSPDYTRQQKRISGPKERKWSLKKMVFPQKK